jgi:uncharacterized protein (DUF1330 family)
LWRSLDEPGPLLDRCHRIKPEPDSGRLRGEEDSLTAYVALTQKVNDVDKYVETYIPQVMPLLEKYGIEVRVAHFGAKAIEGSADSLIILRADSEEVVRAFYDDPEYSRPKALRHSITSDANLVLAPEFAIPG